MSERYPIVLAHGITRPDYLIATLVRRLDLGRLFARHTLDRLHYFRGIASHLRKHGFEVHHSNVSFAASLEVRARDLCHNVKDILGMTGHRKVHIIGHSMGGLDARQMIACEGMADGVASLTTIGTPHLGTSFADWGLDHGGDDVIGVLRSVIDLTGFQDLTTAACRRFNDTVEAREASNGVVYQTYASCQQAEYVFLPLQASWGIIDAKEGANDGLVSVTSQRWRPRLLADGGVSKQITQHDFPLGADHINQTGWWHIYNERPHGRGWFDWFTRGKREYEAKIKAIYLSIAENLDAMT